MMHQSGVKFSIFYTEQVPTCYLEKILYNMLVLKSDLKHSGSQVWLIFGGNEVFKDILQKVPIMLIKLKSSPGSSRRKAEEINCGRSGYLKLKSSLTTESNGLRDSIFYIVL